MSKDLSPAKRALLQKWMQGQSNGHPTSITKRPAGSPSLISFPQRRQLFLELLSPGTPVNNLSVFLEIKGKLNVSVLEQSANKIIARHDILRTCFSFNTGLPVPEILPACEILLPVDDLRNFNQAEQIIIARQLAEKEALRLFDMTQVPLIRLRLYVLSEDRYLLLVIAHHTISDGWSLGVFLRELMLFYQEILNNKSGTLPELVIQYADFVYWQTGEKLEADLRSSLSYWKKQLSGELPVLELPTDQPRGTKQSFSGRTHHFTISSHAIEALEKLARESDASLYMVLLAVYFILLHRYSGQDEIVIGSPIANRNHPDLEKMIGVFINTLALRVGLSGNPDFREMLNQVRNLCMEAYAHQDLPFEKLVEELKPHRDLSRTPIFQAVFNMQNSPMPKLEIPGIEIRFLEIDRNVSQFDLTLMISRLEGQWHATVEYSDELFKPETITRMFQSYQVILEDIIAHFDRPISAIQLTGKKAQQHLVCGLNQTQFDFPHEKCLYHLFDAQAEKTPGAIAIIHNDESLTYGDLQRRVNMIAQHLGSLGVRPGIRVGVLMERSLEIVEALLGVLKAGGIYVPIHTSFPAERIQFILNDADIKVLLTNSGHKLPDNQHIQIINLNEEKIPTNDYSGIQIDSKPGDLAYIIYTSGSTGYPKGVMVRHSSLTNFLWSMRERPGIKENEVLLAVTAISFDIAGLELFLPLLAGATVVIAGEKMITNPALIGNAISHYNVSMMQATPATWQLLIEAGWKGQPGLKALCGGEALTRKLADQLLERVDTLWNMYGPTETTIWSSACKIEKGGDPITIGQPIGNTQLYILDRYIRPVPIGVAGELHIGGEGLAQGYLNLDDLAIEKFIPDPFSSKQGARLYKTGDRARYLPNGSIEIMGRMDDQVKLNGHRIELGEITSQLLQHPSVRESIVMLQTESSGEKRLVAYFIPTHDSSVDLVELREFLGKKLPAYMIPSFFISINSLPLTANGKIDRKALPLPGDIHRYSGYMAPRNEKEKVLAGIWQNVLQMEQVGIHDNFFDLGGASMQSLQVVARAHMYGLQLTIENIFEYQTIAELAANVNGQS